MGDGGEGIRMVCGRVGSVGVDSPHPFLPLARVRCAHLCLMAAATLAALRCKALRPMDEKEREREAGLESCCAPWSLCCESSRLLPPPPLVS